MTTRPRIDQLVRRLETQFPALSAAVDEPADPAGSWFIDLRSKEQQFAVEFRPALGFGLSSLPADGYGAGADEFFTDEDSLCERLGDLVRDNSRTEPQRVRVLQELRERRSVSQPALATRLGIRQPTLSKMERREDMNLSTLRRIVEALGGKLYIRADFQDESVEVKLGEQSRQ